MRAFAAVVFVLTAMVANGQKNLVPGKSAFENKWVKNETAEMVWYALRDTVKLEIGRVVTDIRKEEKQLIVTTEVKMKGAPSKWIDSTIADLHTLKPVRHASYNAQRDMALDFGNPVTGFYHDKIKKQVTEIRDTTREAYFDSNIYSTMIAWLPLHDGYTQNISIYDYNPAGKTGVSTVDVRKVVSGSYETARSGSRNVWVVTLAAEIGGSGNSVSTYFIDKADRKLWKQEINAGNRKMLMERIEQ